MATCQVVLFQSVCVIWIDWVNWNSWVTRTDWVIWGNSWDIKFSHLSWLGHSRQLGHLNSLRHLRQLGQSWIFFYAKENRFFMLFQTCTKLTFGLSDVFVVAKITFLPNLRILSRKNNELKPFIRFLAMTVTTNTSDRPNIISGRRRTKGLSHFDMSMMLFLRYPEMKRSASCPPPPPNSVESSIYFTLEREKDRHEWKWSLQ